MTENLPDTKKWVIGTTIILLIDRYELTLIGIKDSQSGLTKFSGDVDFSANPIGIKHLANRFLSNFNLTLPQTVPDITFTSFGGVAVISPDDKKYYRFYANSNITLPNPFGLSTNALNFDNLKLALNRSVKILPPPTPPNTGDENPTPTETWDTSISVTSDISYTPSGQDAAPITFGHGNFYFVSSGNYALSLFITQEINPAGIIENLLSITIPPEVKTFLPVFKPEAATKPIRLYKASADFTFQDVKEDGSLAPIHFSNGFNLDQLNIGILNTNFLVAMRIVDDNFSITAHSESINLFNLVEIRKKSTDPATATGPGLTVISSTETITLFGRLKFFPNSETPENLDFDFSYSNTEKEFLGDITYDGVIAGQRNPELGFAWKKAGGFRITKFPFDQDKLSDAMNWGEKIKKFANASKGGCEDACGKLADLAFNELITTSYDLKFTPGTSSKVGFVQITVSGTYKIAAVGKSVTDITFSPIPLEIKIPTSFNNLAKAIVDSLVASSETIAEGLWNNKAQITEFFTFVTIKNVTQNQACRLACKVGRDVLVKAFEDLLESAAANALSTAAQAVAAAVGVLAAIASAISWLASKLSGKKSRAERQKAENTRKIQDELLAINNTHAHYFQASGNGKYIEVTWDDIPGKGEGRGRVYYELSWTYDGINKSRKFNRDPNATSYTERIQRSDFKNGVAVIISVVAHYDYNGRSYTTSSPGLVTVNTPILQTPLPIPRNVDLKALWTTLRKKQLGSIETSWNAVHVVPTPNGIICTEYIVALWNITTNTLMQQQIVVASATPLAVTFNLYEDTTPVTPVINRYMPNPSHLFQLKINAIATDPDLNSLIGTSNTFRIPWGIGYVRAGYNFKID